MRTQTPGDLHAGPPTGPATPPMARVRWAPRGDDVSAERKNAPKCGTYGGYQRHWRDGSTPCEPCRAANSAYVKELRSRTTRWREQQRARDRAKQRLVEMYPDDFHRLYVEFRTEDQMAKWATP